MTRLLFALCSVLAGANLAAAALCPTTPLAHGTVCYSKNLVTGKVDPDHRNCCKSLLQCKVNPKWQISIVEQHTCQIKLHCPVKKLFRPGDMCKGRNFQTQQPLDWSMCCPRGTECGKYGGISIGGSITHTCQVTKSQTTTAKPQTTLSYTAREEANKKSCMVRLFVRPMNQKC